MVKPTHHIFVCGSFRPTGSQGICHKKNSLSLLQYLEEEAAERGLDGVMVSSTGCLKSCDNGPIVIVYPHNVWYHEVDETSADEILDAIENDSLVAA
ncbi:ferredoxin [Achromatium sp. WMS2]|nr:ferredoxin [Achromatium sp. WMS2]